MLKKRLGKKGFTLVEIIVVLVILAILAAIMIPSMVGWISKAEEKSAATAGRTLLLAAQTLASEDYKGTAAPAAGDVADLADCGVAAGEIGTIAMDGRKVESITFTYGGNSYTLTNGGEFTKN